MYPVVFMYHGTPARQVRALERQLRAIARWCEVVPLTKIALDPEGAGKHRRRRAALTFDDGLRSNVAIAYPLLQRLGLHATFFVCPGLIERGEWLWTHESRQRLLSLDERARRGLAISLGSPTEVDAAIEWMKRMPLAERRSIEARIRAASPNFHPSQAQREEFDLATWADLKRLDPTVVTLGSHTMTHPILTSLSDAETEVEIAQSRLAIERETGRVVDLFCYPNGEFAQVTLDAVRRHYSAAVIASDDVSPCWNPHRIPRISEGRTGVRGRLGLVRKMVFPYPKRARREVPAAPPVNKAYSARKFILRFPPWRRTASNAERASALSALRADIARTYEDMPGSKLGRLLRCAVSPAVHAVVVFRFGQLAKCQPAALRLIADPVYWVLQTAVQVLWGIELPRSATIGPGLYIGHFGGITISPWAVIGSNCNISQNVTIGAAGHGEKAGAPTIGDNVYVAPGARLFGKIRIGNNVKIGANAVVHKDIPDNAVVALDPGFRIISMNGNRRDLAA